MKNIETIFPYTLIEQDGLYGIVDDNGVIVVPCVMDDIQNIKHEERDLELWNDFSCVAVCKDDLYGFFTNKGKFIEPAYDTFTVDACSGNIHVSIDDTYGVLISPEFVFEELSAEDSLLNEDYPCDDDDEFEDDDEFDDDDEFEDGDNGVFSLADLLAELDEDDEDDEDTMSWSEFQEYRNITNGIESRFYQFGYDYANELWSRVSAEGGEVNMELFVAELLSGLQESTVVKHKVPDIKAQAEIDESMFWDSAETCDDNRYLLSYINKAIKGAAGFISKRCMANADVHQLNRRFKDLLNRDRNDGYSAIFCLVHKLLPCPEDGTFETIPLCFPVELRPACKYNSWFKKVTGRIGEIYLYEHSMHMFHVSVNVYDAEDKDRLLDENHILDASEVVLSELLESIQQILDPEKKNKELKAAIEKALKVENEKSCVAQICKDCGVHLLSLSDFNCHPRFVNSDVVADVDYIYISGDEVMLVMDCTMPGVSVEPLSENCSNYSWILNDIKAAANKAYKSSKSQESTDIVR